jgi:hypothetical protein
MKPVVLDVVLERKLSPVALMSDTKEAGILLQEFGSGGIETQCRGPRNRLASLRLDSPRGCPYAG